LLKELIKGSSTPYTNESMKDMGFGELRGKLKATRALKFSHVTRLSSDFRNSFGK
jgi:hypothetical protein